MQTEINTNYTEMSFNARRAALKEMGFSYSDYAKLKKDDLIPLLESGKPNTRDILEAQTNSFESKGGKVTVCKPQKDQHFNKPGEKQALKPTKRKRKAPVVAKAASGDVTTGDKPEKTAAKPKRSPVKSEGILLKALIRELNVSGTEARKALRTSGIVKPAKQWIWPEGHPDIAKVKELLTGLES